MKLKQQVKDESEIQSASSYIVKNFRNASLTDSHGNTLCYFVNDKELSWAQRFEIMERAKTIGLTEDFIISDTSLEQIFLSFARISH
jgi:UPI0001A2D6C9 related cluster